jgi:type I restriction enzyme M protein
MTSKRNTNELLSKNTKPKNGNGNTNFDPENLRGLINLFSKEIFESDQGGEDVLGRVYEYFMGEFASSEGKRGGEYFTPSSIVKTLVAMLEPEKGKVLDPCCGSGGMFVQSDAFTNHNGRLSFYGQESKDFTYRLCRMNLFIHLFQSEKYERC